MPTFFRYLRNLFHQWWAIGGALSLVGFFVPRLNEFPAFIVGVAVVAFLIAGYQVHREQAEATAVQLREEGQRQAQQVASLHAQHHSALEEERKQTSNLRAEIEELRRPRFTNETRQEAERAYRDLKREHKIVLRQMYVGGDMTDRQALKFLQAKGLATNWGSVFSHLSSETPFVQRSVQARQYGEHVRGYEGTYVVNPQFRDVLEHLLLSDPESTT